MSTVTKALNVAGSIGGLAQSVGNLANLVTSWLTDLKPASFGGVPFGVESVRTSAGRKTSVHTYPFRDDVWVEDLGKKARQFEVLGFLVENDLITKQGSINTQRNKLLDACEKAGPQTLVHPTLGTVASVSCLGVELTERRDLGGAVEFRLTLIVTGARLYPTAAPSPGDGNKQNAAQTGLAALANFVKSTLTSIAAGAVAVEQAVSTAVGWYQMAVTAVNDAKSIIGAVSTLSGNFGNLFGGANNGYAGANAQAQPNVTATDLLCAATAARATVISAGAALQAAAGNPSDSATLGAAVQTLLSSVAATANNPADAVRLISNMAQFNPPAVTTPGQMGAAMATMQVALAALFRRYALAQLATTLTTYQPASQNDANAVLAQATGLLDNEITIAGDAGDDQTYQALRALRQSVVADMAARGANLAVIATFNFQAALPSLVLANRIYRDPTREPGLAQQINPIHPAFCPTTFQALAS